MNAIEMTGTMTKAANEVNGVHALEASGSLQVLTAADAAAVRGGYTDWLDVFYGALYALDLTCIYTRNPYVCGAAMVGHGVDFLVDF